MGCYHSTAASPTPGAQSGGRGGGISREGSHSSSRTTWIECFPAAEAKLGPVLWGTPNPWWWVRRRWWWRRGGQLTWWQQGGGDSCSKLHSSRDIAAVQQLSPPQEPRAGVVAPAQRRPLLSREGTTWVGYPSWLAHFLLGPALLPPSEDTQPTWSLAWSDFLSCWCHLPHPFSRYRKNLTACFLVGKIPSLKNQGKDIRVA